MPIFNKKYKTYKEIVYFIHREKKQSIVTVLEKDQKLGFLEKKI
jgi:hypothetical protein